MKPFIKWAGGKRKFAERIADTIGNTDGTYYEPFLGSGALLFHICPQHAMCSDVNQELINLYEVVKNDIDALIAELETNFVPNHCHDFYYDVRSWDRDLETYCLRSKTQKAARLIYLNKTCYNGIWRVNAKGQNNVPIGRYVKPAILVPEELRNANKYFNENDIKFKVADFKDVIQDASVGDFVYFDPPYDVDEGQSSFLAYTQSLFNRTRQVELKDVCDRLVDRGVRVGISNSNTSFIRDLYLSDNRYELSIEFKVNRTIGSSESSRRQFSEIFILSHYE